MGTDRKEFKPFRMGKFLLLDHLASGGMAELYLAKTVGAGGFEKIQAVKAIFPQYANNEDFRAMFEREAQICSQLTHANIVQIYDFIRVNENFLLSMEYVDGKNLRQILAKAERQKVKIPVEVSIYIVMEMCRGLDYAHKKKDPQTHEPLRIIHRDISPQNLMISYEGSVKIVDFGIAKARNKADITRSGVVKGKFAYMSPEQAQGQEGLDHRSDIFSAGIVLFECLTQDRLFASDDDFQTLRKINECQVPKISRLNPSIPYELEKIVYKVLAKDPAARYQSSTELASSLQKLLTKHWEHTNQEFVAHWVRKLFAEDIVAERKRREVQEQLAKTLGQEALESVRDTLMPIDGEMTRIREQMETRISDVPSTPVVDDSETTGGGSVEEKTQPFVLTNEGEGFISTSGTGVQKAKNGAVKKDDEVTKTQARVETPTGQGVQTPIEMKNFTTSGSGLRVERSGTQPTPRSQTPVPKTSLKGMRSVLQKQEKTKKVNWFRATAALLFLGLGALKYLGDKKEDPSHPVQQNTVDLNCEADPEKCLARKKIAQENDERGTASPPILPMERTPIPPASSEPTSTWRPPSVEVVPPMVVASVEAFQESSVPEELKKKLRQQKTLSWGDVRGRFIQMAVFPDGTDVFWGKQNLGKTPFIWEVPAQSEDDSSEITLSKPGFYGVKMTFSQFLSLLQDRRGGRSVSTKHYDFYFEHGLKRMEPAYLTIHVDPPSKVYVDGRFVGVSPVTDLEVLGGTHKIQLVNEALQTSQEHKIHVESGKRPPAFEYSLFKGKP